MIGILSDAHGNLPAFNLAINILKRNGANKLIFLGDAVGYLPTPDVISAIQDLGENISCIRGNHEDILLSGVFDPEREQVYQHEATLYQMNAAQVGFIKSWPEKAIKEFAAGSAIFIHGSPKDSIYGYVYQDADFSTFTIKESFVFMGHTHRPFVRQYHGKTFINVGSCGLPRDHGALGAAALFDEQTGSVRIIRFDIMKETQNIIDALGLVHPSVISLLTRRHQELEGEIYEK